MTQGQSASVESNYGEPLFVAGGEVGALLSQMDWASSPLGPVSSWSPALQTMVGMLLRSGSPLVLWWGPSLVQIYNDAYRSILGAKHPAALGQSARSCWSEIWDVLGPMIEPPQRGEAATGSDDLQLMIIRKGFVEETHLKVACSPVPDTTLGYPGIGGVLGTATEITEQVHAGRQLATLRDLARHSTGAATGAMACESSARALSENEHDVPCSLFYLVNADSKTVQLVASTGFGGSFLEYSPPKIALGEHSVTEWPMTRTIREGILRVLRDRQAAVVSELEWMDLPRGAWPGAPQQVVILPLASPEQSDAYGVLVFGVNRHRALTQSYLSFFDLVADQVAAAIRDARAYQRERERAKKVAEVDRAKTAFFSNVSHEFRTPLTLLLGPLEELRAESSASGAGRERVELIHRNALRLLKLVNTLLNFSQIEAGRVEAEYVPSDLSALTIDLATSFRALLERAGIALVVDCPPLSAPTYVDQDMWEKIVLNLMSNAFKFTFDGSIRVQLRAVEDAIELVVADTGIGVAEQDVSRLFERFQRVLGARSRSHEGSGIGLAFVRELVRMHGGEVYVTSVIGKGTRFTVRIPRGSAHLPKEQIKSARSLVSAAPNARAFVDEARDWGSPTQSSRHPVSAPNEDAPLRRQRIVYADDNRDMREYVARLLGKGWEVETVADGVLALEEIARNPPALVLADVMMPRLDGLGLLRALRADPATRTLPVILLSARVGEQSTMAGLQAGANDYLYKPFSPADLLIRVSSQLKIASLRDALLQEREAGRQVLETLFNDAPAAIALIRGPDLTIAFANARYVELWQRTMASELVGKPLLVALPELRGQGFDEALRQVMASGRPLFGNDAPVTVERAGKQVVVRLNFVYVPTRDSAGVIDGVSVFAFDVTREIEARGQAQLGEQVGRALVTKENLAEQLHACCQALVQTGAAFARIWTYDETHEVLHLRASAGIYSHVTGTHARIALGEHKIGRIGQTRTPQIIKDVIGHPEIADQEWAKREGITAFVGYPLLVAQRLVGVVALYTKRELSEGMMTAVSMAADQMAIAVDREAGERFRELFIGILGHDLRNPLNAVSMATYLLKLNASEADRRVLDRVDGSTKRMERMIAQLLDFARARSGGGIVLAREVTDLHVIVTQAVGELRVANPDRVIEVTSAGDVGGSWDADRMLQVFSNLIANALTYGSRDAPVHVVLTGTDSEARCIVHNHGPPIPSDLMPHLFDPFRRARHATAAAAQGLGLGLFICQQIVTAHGGTLTVQSTEQGGTQFTVTVPLSLAVPQ